MLLKGGQFVQDVADMPSLRIHEGLFGFFRHESSDF